MYRFREVREHLGVDGFKHKKQGTTTYKSTQNIKTSDQQIYLTSR
uniref:Uncharacterized protein n=1 Tax=Anguilla anguilla TaxID=7936 RepID=A0A0E9SPR7_ANGAN